MKKHCRGIRYAALLLLLPCSVFGYTPFSSDALQVWTGAGYMGGDVSYRIGGHVVDSVEGPYNVHYPISELKWPVNVPVATTGAKLRLFDRVEFYGQYSKANAGYSGKTEDSDWFYYGMPENYLYEYRSIFSLSDATVEGYSGEGSVRYWLKNSHAFDSGERYGFGAGLIYQKFDWVASDLDQWYPMDPEYAHDIVAGKVGTYSATLTVPYLEFLCEMKGAHTLVSGSVGVSPCAMASDEDYHLLRSIHSKTDAQGFAWLATFSAKYDFWRYLFIAASAQGMSLSTAGTQDTVVYAGADAGQSWTIDHKITSLQYNILLTLGLRY